MKRILFIDDEPLILEGIRALLRKSRDRWHMVFADGPEAALGEIDRATFDVIVSDMRMPGMDGAGMLTLVKERQPAAARIVLSGYSERESVLRAVPVAHQFLPKPCNPATLEMTIDRACGGPGLVSDERLRAAIGATYQLPSVSRTFRELLVLLDQPTTSIAEVAALLESDPAMSAKTLQLVNSAFFSLPRRVASVRQAVVYLGLEAVRSVALAASAFAVLENVPESLVQHVCRRGMLAGSIARFVDPKGGDDAFTAAMLQDIGQLVLASCLPAESARIRARSVRENLAIEEVEMDALGLTHAQVGAHLLALWGLPSSIVEGVAFSHTPEVHAGRSFDIPAVTHVAGCIAGEVAGAPPGQLLDEAWVASFGAESLIANWRERARALASARVAA